VHGQWAGPGSRVADVNAVRSPRLAVRGSTSDVGAVERDKVGKTDGTAFQLELALAESADAGTPALIRTP